MADNQNPPIEVTEENLEEMTNVVMGGEVPESAKDKPEQPEEAKPVEAAPVETPPEQAVVPEIPEWLKETPYKNPEDLVKGYKSLQSEMTKRMEKIKPFEQFLSVSASDPNVLPLLQNALALYQNPELQRAYRQPVYQRPNPWDYDQSPEGQKKFNEDLELYEQRKFNDLLNTRLGAIESQNRRDLARFQFQQRYPDADLMEVEQFMQKSLQGETNPYDAAYKLMTYEQVKAKALEEARKELAKQLETAGKTGTPKPASTAPKTATIDSILDYVGKYSVDAAYKKFGNVAVDKAIQEATNQYM